MTGIILPLRHAPDFALGCLVAVMVRLLNPLLNHPDTEYQAGSVSVGLTDSCAMCHGRNISGSVGVDGLHDEHVRGHCAPGVKARQRHLYTAFRLRGCPPALCPTKREIPAGSPLFPPRLGVSFGFLQFPLGFSCVYCQLQFSSLATFAFPLGLLMTSLFSCPLGPPSSSLLVSIQ